MQAFFIFLSPGTKNVSFPKLKLWIWFNLPSKIRLDAKSPVWAKGSRNTIKRTFMEAKRITPFLIFMLVLFASAASEKLWSQSVTEYGSTLSGWFNQQRLFSLDRSNTFGGFYYDRGLFKLHTPDMSTEYAIDLFRYRFTSNDDQKWYSADNGFRTTAGSLNNLLFAVHSGFKHRLQIKNGESFSIEAHQQKDLRANRAFSSLNTAKPLARATYWSSAIH